MELTLKQTELAVLVLHLNIMRKNVKKGFKSNYGRSEGKEKIQVYDNLKELFQDEINEEIENQVCFVLDPPLLEMLHSFINWYVTEIKLSMDSKSFDKEELISNLETIKEKVNNYMVAALEEV